jgi:polyphosphate glucokinase
MKVLVIDIGGTHVKILATGQKEHREFRSGPTLTPRRMLAGVKNLSKDWKYDRVSIGFPGPVLRNRPLAEPHNLAKGWVGFNFDRAFKCPVKVMNDAAMQALGSYRRGKMLFLGLGTGLGSAMIVNGIVEPMELAHLPYKRATYEDYVGLRGLKNHGKKKWRKHVADVVERLIAALEPDDVVLGGGNVKKLKDLPKGCRVGDNANAFIGGFRIWTQRRMTKSIARRRPARAHIGPVRGKATHGGTRREGTSRTPANVPAKQTVRRRTQRSLEQQRQPAPAPEPQPAADTHPSIPEETTPA